MPRLPENLDVLREVAFRRLLGAAAISWFGDRMVTVALAFAVLEISESASSIGLVLAARTGAQLVCLLLGGVVADRASRRAIMVGADISRLLTQGLLAATRGRRPRRRAAGTPAGRPCGRRARCRSRTPTR